MQAIKFQAPADLQAPATLSDPAGRQLAIAADGSVTVDPALTDVLALRRAGFSACTPSGNTASRPTRGAPGLMFFDTTLGKPIWRNAAGSGWVDATGAAA